jgi:biopolymer transport protein ExbD
MPSYEDLKRINKANSIINRSNLNLGVRPMYIQDSEENTGTDLKDKLAKIEKKYFSSYVEQEAFEASQQSFAEESSEEPRQKIVNVEDYYAGALLDQESEAETQYQYSDQETYQEFEYEDEDVDLAYENTTEADQESYFDAQRLSSRPLFQKQESDFSLLKSISIVTLIIFALLTFVFVFKPFANSNSQDELPAITKNSNTVLKQKLIITSGNFVSQNSALLYQKNLKERLGVNLKLIKTDEVYTIQIGDAYANHEDALIVFDELSRYSVKNLAIKVSP